MKKVLIFLFALIILVSIGCFFVISQLDLNKMKPTIEEELSKALQTRVTIGELGWSLNNGLILNELNVFPQGSSELDKAALYLKKGQMKAQLIPLLKKKLVVESVLLEKPMLNLVKGVNGQVAIYGLNAVGGAPSTESDKSEDNVQNIDAHDESAALPSFEVNIIQIRDAVVHFFDESTTPLTKIRIQDLDVDIKDIAIGKNIKMEAKMSIFSQSQNIRLSGALRADALAGPFSIHGLKLHTDLDTIELSELKESIPVVQNLGLRDDLGGEITIQINNLNTDSTQLSFESVVKLLNGSMSLDSIPSPLQGVNMDAVLTQNELRVESFKANFANGIIQATANSKLINAKPDATQLKLTIRELSLEDAILSRNQNEASLQGRVSADFIGESKGISWPEISSTLTGSGSFAVNDAVLLNMNLLKLVMDQLGRIPGVSEAVQAYLPPYYQERMAMRHTVLAPMQFNVQIQNGMLHIPELRIAADGIELYGKGIIGLAGQVDCTATLVLDQNISAALMNGASQLGMIADPYGRLTLPVRITGVMGKLQVIPDIQYVLQRVIQSKGRDLLLQVLQ